MNETPAADKRYPPLDLTPTEFEHEVRRLFGELGQDLKGFRIENQESLSGVDGEYVIDVTVRFEAVGVAMLILVECKRYGRAVERSDVQVLNDKVRSVGAQKGILVTTSNFQRGALKYAAAHGIALIRLLDEGLTYGQKSMSHGSTGDQLAAARARGFVGIKAALVSVSEEGESWHFGRSDVLRAAILGP